MFEAYSMYEVRSAGTEENARIKVTAGHVGWADVIFVMEKKHLRRLQAKFAAEFIGKQTICLGIPDEYSYMDDDLIELLKSSVSDYIEVPD